MLTSRPWKVILFQDLSWEDPTFHQNNVLLSLKQPSYSTQCNDYVFCKLTNHPLAFTSKLLINITGNKCPSINPCGAQLITDFYSERYPSTTILRLLSPKLILNPISWRTLDPMWTFWTSLLCGSLLNVLLKTKHTKSAARPLSMSCHASLKKLNKLIVLVSLLQAECSLKNKMLEEFCRTRNMGEDKEIACSLVHDRATELRVWRGCSGPLCSSEGTRMMTEWSSVSVSTFVSGTDRGWW